MTQQRGESQPSTVQRTTQRIADLLISPRETLEVEIKGWIDIVNDAAHKAALAKAIIALANHGGGAILIGFQRSDSGMVPSQDRPPNLSCYTSDTVNATIVRYAEPAFHCDVQVEPHPETGELFPIITVPGGHTTPIRAKRSGPNGQTIQQHSYYIRRSGPQSEPPQTGHEWDRLIRRCLANARDDLLKSFRILLAGGIGTPPSETDSDRVARWYDSSKARWSELVESLPADHPARFVLGSYSIAYGIFGDLQGLKGLSLLEAVREGGVRHTGWPPFWVPTRMGMEPYIQDNNIECWLGRDSHFQDPAHSDFWRVSPEGEFFLIRGYQEDGSDVKSAMHGTLFDITLPTWRLGETMLHAASMSRRLATPQANIVFLIECTGLANRKLTHLAGTRLMVGNHVAHQNSYRAQITAQADHIEGALPELVHNVLRPMYELFDFFQLPVSLVLEELARMRSGRF